MTTSNTYGRQVVVPLTNKSGGSVAAGDVVVIDTSNNDAFTTDTAGAFTGGVGIAQETIANNAVGRILLSGYAALVNVNASVTRGQFGKTHTVAKQATGTASRGVGTFCQWLTGGTTPDAIVYPVDLLSSSLANPLTTTGDLIYSSSGTTAARRAIGSSGDVLTVTGGVPVWAAPSAGTAPVCGSYRQGAADVTTTSTSFVDLTSYSLTITTLARRVFLVASIASYNSGVNVTHFTFTVDGTEVSSRSNGLYQQSGGQSGSNISTATIEFLTDVLTAASHTFKVQWKVGGGTGTVYGNASNLMNTFSAQETMFTA